MIEKAAGNGSGATDVATISAYDLPTLDKIPVIKRLMAVDGGGRVLDIGVGTGFTTSKVFAGRTTVCVDLHQPNLLYYRRYAECTGIPRPLCVVAKAEALPFAEKSFRFILCSEVLEHLQDDDATVRECARLLSPGGKVVVTVPYTGLKFTSFLELCRIKTVHDFPGPEQHVRPGYDERTLGELFTKHALRLDQHAYYLRFFTRLTVDLVSIAHLLYQRIVHRRRSWTWSEAADAEGGVAFRLYRRVFPLLRATSSLDGLLASRRGFGLVAAATRDNAMSAGRDDIRNCA